MEINGCAHLPLPHPLNEIWLLSFLVKKEFMFKFIFKLNAMHMHFKGEIIIKECNVLEIFFRAIAQFSYKNILLWARTTMFTWAAIQKLIDWLDNVLHCIGNISAIYKILSCWFNVLVLTVILKDTSVFHLLEISIWPFIWITFDPLYTDFLCIN